MDEEKLNDLLDDALNDLISDDAKPDPPPETSKAAEIPEATEESMDRFFVDMKKQLDEVNISEQVPEIFDLMQNLLSKELLYPALKDLSPKFDEWLQKQQDLSKADKRRYKKQRDIINEIIEVFDDESLDGQAKFLKNLDLMEKMQSLGAPPSELTVPEGMGKCSVM